MSLKEQDFLRPKNFGQWSSRKKRKRYRPNMIIRNKGMQIILLQ